MSYTTSIQEVDFQRGVQDSVMDLQLICHGLAKEAGWWGPYAQLPGGLAEPTAQDVAEKLLLVHCELSEAVEGRRKGLKDDHLPHLDMFVVELADALIRIFDLAGAMQLDLATALQEKMVYNTKRADHKPENRAMDGGKKF